MCLFFIVFQDKEKKYPASGHFTRSTNLVFPLPRPGPACAGGGLGPTPCPSASRVASAALDRVALLHAPASASAGGPGVARRRLVSRNRNKPSLRTAPPPPPPGRLVRPPVSVGGEHGRHAWPPLCVSCTSECPVSARGGGRAAVAVSWRAGPTAGGGCTWEGAQGRVQPPGQRWEQQYRAWERRRCDRRPWPGHPDVARGVPAPPTPDPRGLLDWCRLRRPQPAAGAAAVRKGTAGWGSPGTGAALAQTLPCALLSLQAAPETPVLTLQCALRGGVPGPAVAPASSVVSWPGAAAASAPVHLPHRPFVHKYLNTCLC